MNFKWNRAESAQEAVLVHERCATDTQAEIAIEDEVRMVLDHNPATACGVCGGPLKPVFQ